MPQKTRVFIDFLVAELAPEAAVAASR